MAIDLAQLPDTFYRVSVKALIFDSQNRLLIFQDKNGEWEIPGGGWDHTESFEDCIRREIMEEMQLKPDSIGQIRCVYKCRRAGHYKICIAVPVKIHSSEFIPSSDDLVAARYVNKEEFLRLLFQESEAGVLEVADEIWSEQ